MYINTQKCLFMLVCTYTNPLSGVSKTMVLLLPTSTVVCPGEKKL